MRPVYIVSIRSIVMTLAFIVLGTIMLVQWLTGTGPPSLGPVNTGHVTFYEHRTWSDPRVCIADTDPATARVFPGQRWCQKD